MRINRLLLLAWCWGLAGCVPRIEVVAPDDPITINMNVKIEHDIHIKADKDVKTLLKNAELSPKTAE